MVIVLSFSSGLLLGDDGGPDARNQNDGDACGAHETDGFVEEGESEACGEDDGRVLEDGGEKRVGAAPGAGHRKLGARSGDRHAEESGADLVIAHYNRISPPKPRAEGSQRPERPTRVQTFGFLMEGPMTKEEFAAGLMQEPASFYYGVMWNKLYRADIVRAHDDVICAEDMDWSEDLYFNLSYIRYAEKFYALSTPIYNYFNTPGSAVHTALNPVNVVATRATLFAYYKELYEHLGLYEEYKPQIYKYLVAVAEA